MYCKIPCLHLTCPLHWSLGTNSRSIQVPWSGSLTGDLRNMFLMVGSTYVACSGPPASHLKTCIVYCSPERTAGLWLWLGLGLQPKGKKSKSSNLETEHAKKAYLKWATLTTHYFHWLLAENSNSWKDVCSFALEITSNDDFILYWKHVGTCWTHEN